MGLFGKLSILWKNRKILIAANKFSNQIKGEYMKSGIKSTEFWMTMITSASTIFEAFKGNLDPKWAAVITAGLSMGYTLARALTKAAASVSSASDVVAAVDDVNGAK